MASVPCNGLVLGLFPANKPRFASSANHTTLFGCKAGQENEWVDGSFSHHRIVAQCFQFPSQLQPSKQQRQRHFKSTQNYLFLILKNSHWRLNSPAHSAARSTSEDVCAEVDTAIVFTTGGYHMSRTKPGGMISAFV